MKWTNKGHQYDKYATIFAKGKKLYIYGAGENGKRLCDKFQRFNCVEGFIDNSVEKQGTSYSGVPIYTIFDALKGNLKESIVVVAVSVESRNMIMQQMRTLGFEDSRNLFFYADFEDYFWPIYLLYAWDKLYFSSVGLTLTTVCNLRCKGCLAFIPHNKNPKMYDVEQFKSSVDNMFRNVDYVDVFQLSGGETFLYPEQNELIAYIGERYRDKIGIFYTTTNGTVMPKNELLQTMKEHKVTVIVDDYTETIPENKDKTEKLIETLQEHDIMLLRNKVERWIDLAPTTTDNSHLSEEELIDYYGACSQPWIELYNNYLYSCNYAQYAMRAELIEDSENDRFSLEGDVDRRALLEFRNGYTQKGYVEMCKKCAGYVLINKNKIKPAEQER